MSGPPSKNQRPLPHLLSDHCPNLALLACPARLSLPGKPPSHRTADYGSLPDPHLIHSPAGRTDTAGAHNTAAPPPWSAFADPKIRRPLPLCPPPPVY